MTNENNIKQNNNPFKRVGDTVDGIHSCTSTKYGDCLYFDILAEKNKCNAPIGVNRICMKPFREYKKTPAYEKWKADYIKKIMEYGCL